MVVRDKREKCIDCGKPIDERMRTYTVTRPKPGIICRQCRRVRADDALRLFGAGRNKDARVQDGER